MDESGPLKSACDDGVADDDAQVVVRPAVLVVFDQYGDACRCDEGDTGQVEHERQLGCLVSGVGQLVGQPRRGGVVQLPDGVDDDSAIVGTAPQAQDVVLGFLRRVRHVTCPLEVSQSREL